ncbi:MAG: VanZ family protein [Bifidobacteriaceae bacterium]|jgi:glycopeptide antibiotics resistance protein|nr:VanZ family protein [Bifidobacteriaceae bacterium]
MLSEFGPSTILAVFTGAALALAAFLPVVALRYRRVGRLRLIDIVLLVVCAVYFVALWTYTLVPVPESGAYQCAAANLRPFAFLDSIRQGGGWRPTNPALLQVVFNVVLFMPLGALARLVLRWGAAVATAAGLATTAVIEFSQLTGLFGIFPCAYRVFDVDDLAMNTLGALLGSLAAMPFARLRRHPAPKVAVVRVGRRLVGVLADLMVIGITSFATVVAARALLLYGLEVPPAALDVAWPQAAGSAAALALEAAWVLLDGRTCGEAIVDLRPVEAAPAVGRRLVKLVSGVGGYIALGLFDSPAAPTLLAVFSLVSLILIFITRDHRGLSGLAAGLPMGIDPPAPGRPQVEPAERPQAPPAAP